MSATSITFPYRGSISENSQSLSFSHNETLAQPPCIVRRRLNPQSGRAIEQIGHAIDYLIDSRAVLASTDSTEAIEEAVFLLARASRDIFAESPMVVPLRRRLAQWIESALLEGTSSSRDGHSSASTL